MSSSKRPPEPWDSFFKELDHAVDTAVRLDCIGGFVVTLLYGTECPLRMSMSSSLRRGPPPRP
jgi:hypothetical protein